MNQNASEPIPVDSVSAVFAACYWFTT